MRQTFAKTLLYRAVLKKYNKKINYGGILVHEMNIDP